MGADRAVCSRCNRRAPIALILALSASPAVAFAPSRLPAISRVQAHHCPTDGSLAGEKQGRRAALRRLHVAGGAAMVGDLFGGLFGGRSGTGTCPGRRRRSIDRLRRTEVTQERSIRLLTNSRRSQSEKQWASTGAGRPQQGSRRTHANCRGGLVHSPS
jgi:hypothetical protein